MPAKKSTTIRKNNPYIEAARDCLGPLLSINPRAYQSNRGTRTNGWIRLAGLLDMWMVSMDTGVSPDISEVDKILEWSTQELHLPKSKRDSEYRNLCFVVMTTALLLKAQVSDD